ncbi:exo-alpha-sialidase [Sphingobacterium cellulitidis]|uniref:exo-alpha-sialidase n=1 Tax=Sphingobacterium cellulitidis TaxID=1768011 RepID=UPI003C7B8CB5
MKRLGIFILLLFVCSSVFVHASDIEIRYYQLPLLLGKNNNPIARITLEAKKEDVGKEIGKLSISLEGSTNFNDLTTISLYTSKMDSSIKPNLNKLDQIVSIEPTSSKIIIPLNYKIQMEGKQYFWISLGLRQDVDLLNKIVFQVNSISTNKNRIAGNYKEKKVFRPAFSVRNHMQDGVHTSRIPGLATSKKGTLLAIYDARYESSRDLQGHMDIAVQRSFDKGQTWEPIQIALDMKTWGSLPEKFNGVSDACILVDQNSGDIYIAGLWMYGVKNKEGEWVEGLTDTSKTWNHQWLTKGSQPGFDVKQTAQFLITKSTDDGKTWSEPVNITKQGKKEEWWLWAPAPGQGITMADGTLVFPTQGRDKNGNPFSNITYSKDAGKTWHSSSEAVLIEKGTTECAVVELEPGVLMLNMRANRNRGTAIPNNGRAVATTTDFGKTWETHPTSLNALIEPTCMASLHKHQFKNSGTTKEILFFCNPHSIANRDHITLQTSFDYGKTWPNEKHILLDEWSGRGYSCITSVDDKSIGILYEGSQSDMVFQRIPIDEVIKD